MRSGQGSGVREIRLRRLMRRGLETGSRRTYTGTKLETADTAKGSLRSTAPVLDPTVEDPNPCRPGVSFRIEGEEHRSVGRTGSRFSPSGSGWARKRMR